jgi:hypothetical protein
MNEVKKTRKLKSQTKRKLFSENKNQKLKSSLTFWRNSMGGAVARVYIKTKSQHLHQHL